MHTNSSKEIEDKQLFIKKQVKKTLCAITFPFLPKALLERRE